MENGEWRMEIRVRFFAMSRELAGTEEEMWNLADGATMEDLQGQLFERWPALQAQRVRFAVNRAYAPLTTVLHADDEVACIPPVGGG